MNNLARAEFTTIAGWNNQLFPSYVVATATLKPADNSETEAEEEDETVWRSAGLFGIEIESPDDDVTIKVTILGSDIMEPSVFTGTLAEEGEEYTIRPRIRYKFNALAQNKQATPVTVTFRVEIEDEDGRHRSRRANRNDHAPLDQRLPVRSCAKVTSHRPVLHVRGLRQRAAPLRRQDCSAKPSIAARSIPSPAINPAIRPKSIARSLPSGTP